MNLGGFFRSHTDCPQGSVSPLPKGVSEVLIRNVHKNRLGPSHSQAFALIHTGGSQEGPRGLTLPHVSDTELGGSVMGLGQNSVREVLRKPLRFLGPVGEERKKAGEKLLSACCLK